MPRGDRTGPMGMGPRTGRAAGFCAGFNAPGYAGPAPGRGMGMGRGRNAGGGRGWRNMFYASNLPRWMRFGGNAAANYDASSPEVEKQVLIDQVHALQSELNQLRKRMDELGS